MAGCEVSTKEMGRRRLLTFILLTTVLTTIVSALAQGPGRDGKKGRRS
jgi:predicted MFS family arabinose efflux permease